MSRKKIFFTIVVIILVVVAVIFLRHSSKVVPQMSEQEVHEKVLSKNGGLRSPTQKGKKEVSKKIALVPRVKERFRKPKKIIKSLKLPTHLMKSEKAIAIGNSKYRELIDIAAIPFRDPFVDKLAREEKLGSLNGFILVSREVLKNRDIGKSVVINAVTGEMSIISGMISVVYKDDDSFQNNEVVMSELNKVLPEATFVIQRNFPHIYLSIWDSGSLLDLKSLLKAEDWLKKRPEVKKAALEVLKNTKTVL